MNGIISWASAICIASIICAISEFLIPKGSMDKTLRFVFGAFMLCAIVMPLQSTISGIKINVDNIIPQSSECNSAKDTLKQQTISTADDNVEKLCEQSLKENKISFNKITVFMDTNADNCISIIEINIYIRESDKNQRNKVINCIQKDIGVIPKVYIVEDE
ncbi:MAG: stage III sporulation protein AF [Bacillota bacterium]|nr:stage III sporulation protein AF [Bacillota bacterium]